MSLLAELRQRKMVQWLLAYLAGAWVLLQVADMVGAQFGWPAGLMRGLTIAAAVGVFVVLLLAWYHGERGAQRVSGTELLLLTLLLAIGGGMLWKFAPTAPVSRVPAAAKPAAAATAPAAAAKSIAVLPFVNMSTDPENEFFSDGLSEEILNSLARIEGMQVVARTSSFQFKGRNQDLRDIGEKLGVAVILEGSVRREGERARITAQLIRARDGFHLWSQTYDRTVKDTLAVQLDIAEQVAGALDVLLDDTQRARMRKAGVADVDAFIAYQKGWKLYEDAHGRPGVDLLEGLRAANAEFDRATALEPDFFEAHFAKVDLYEHALQRDTLGETKWREAQSAALQTLDLASANARDEQQRLLTVVERKMLSDDWRGLRQDIEAALAAPGCWGSNWMPVFASAFGYAEGLDQLGTRAIACDPLNSITRNTRTTVAFANGKGQRVLDRLPQYGPNPRPAIRYSKAIALAMVGRTDEAGRELEAASAGGRTDAYALARIVVGRARGESPVAIHQALQGLRRAQGKFNQWLVVDAVEAANAGNRAEANRLATAMDARPAGPFLLAVMSTNCFCGAPFDLEATPNFKARLAESGLAWPPKPAIAFPPRAPVAEARP